MRPHRTRRKPSGISSLHIIAWLAVAVFILLIGFIGWVYFFAPPLENGVTPAPTSPAAAAKPADPTPAPTPAAIGGLPQPPGGITTTTTTFPSSPVAGVAPAPTSSAVAPPVGVVFRSSLYPYTVTVPKDWSPRAGVKVGSLTVDGFVGPRQNNFTPSVTIYGQKVEAGVDSAAFVRANMQSVTGGGAQAQAEPSADPSGANASMVTYPATSGELRYMVNQAFFVQKGIGWVITLSSQSAPGAETGAYVAVLRQMLASFKAD